MKKNHKIMFASFGICMILMAISIITMEQADFSKRGINAQNSTKNEIILESVDEYQTVKQTDNDQKLEVEDAYAVENLIDIDDEKELFYVSELTDEIKERITGISYPKDQTDMAISYEELSYVHVLYYDFHDQVKEGELICNQVISDDLLEIFEKLFDAKDQIESIRLIDEFGGDDEASMEADNTSCFNYRVVTGTKKMSNHAYGLAIDLNPFYNPYVTTRNGQVLIQPAGSEAYCDRDQKFAHKITHEDLAYQLFTEHGFTWGGDWKKSKDYQHFEYKKPVESSEE